MASVSWLIDMGYIVKASENRFKLDYVEAKTYLEEQCGATRAFLFNGYDTAYGISPRLWAFYDTIAMHNFKVRLHPMQSGPPGTNRQRRVDVDFSAHLIWQASLPEIEKLIITSGDQDFVPAVELVRCEYKKPVILFSYETMVHRDLVDCVNDWWRFETQENRLAKL